MKIQELRGVEEDIIEEVSKQQDNSVVIEGSTLTEKLIQSRFIHKKIGKILIEIKNSMVTLMKVSKLYKPLSVRAAKFFYLIMDMVKLNNMYQFTHDWFKDFFQDFLNHCRWPSESNQKRTTES